MDLNSIQNENDKINFQFNKQFHFECPSNEDEAWKLPAFNENRSKSSYNLSEFQSMKDELNKVKSKLNELTIEIWSEHTRNMNPAGDIVWRVRNEIKGEFVTQAWCKIYECLFRYKLIPKNNDETLNSLHLCEAPGAFITSLNHFLQLNHPDISWKWIGTTLNPYYEGNCLENMIIDDRFIVQTLQNWDFGADYTGNIMNLENIKHLKEKCRDMNGINFVTADGSIDCMLQPENQEQYVASLHYAETVVALQVLSQGGNFLLKMFTLFEDSSISLLYLLNTVFNSVDIFKPCTSKEGNSEVYVICKGFQPNQDLTKYLNEISNSNFNTEFGIFPIEQIPKSFIAQIRECSKLFMSIQIQVIERNLQLFEKLSKKDSFAIKSLRHKILLEYYARYELKQIPCEKKILNRNKAALDNHMNLNPRQHIGSYVERKHRKSMCEEEKYRMLQNQLQSFVMEFAFDGPINFSIVKNDESYQKITPRHGKIIEKLTSSKFIYTPKLRLFLEITDLLKNCKIPPEFSSLFERKTNQDMGMILSIEPLSYLSEANYDSYEKKIALEIIEILLNGLCRKKSNQNLIIQNLLLLSQFLAGLIFYIGHSFFENLYFYKEGAIVLLNFKERSSEIQTNLKSLKKLIENKSFSNSNEAIIGLIDLKVLFRHAFYTAVVQYNTSLVLKYSLNYLKFYDDSSMK